MKSNELQHYGVKGMRWEHRKGVAKRTTKKTTSKKSTASKPVATTISSNSSPYQAGAPVPGQPGWVYSGSKDGGMMIKKNYDEWKKNEDDPLYDAKVTVKDLPKSTVDAGKEMLDKLFLVGKKR